MKARFSCYMPGWRWFLVHRVNLTRHHGAFMPFMSFGFNSRQCNEVMPDKRSRDILSNSFAEPEADIERRAAIIHRLVTRAIGRDVISQRQEAAVSARLSIFRVIAA